MSDDPTPAFAREITATLAVHSDFVLHGNVHDVFRQVHQGAEMLVDLVRLLSGVLADRGIDCLVVVSPVHGLRSLPAPGDAGAAARDAAAGLLQGDLDSGRAVSLERLAEHMTTVGQAASGTALVIEDAGRLAVDVQHLDPAEHAFFVRASRRSRDVSPKSRGTAGASIHNPVVWVVEHERDLPAWLTADNERIRTVAIPRPDYGEREATARLLARSLPGAPPDAAARFAEHAEGLALAEMREVVRLMLDRGLDDAGIPDAVRTYRLGVLDSPWRRGYLRDRLADGEKNVSARVVGQDAAVTKTLDILKRAALGLSGAQASSASSRPRGVLFFAGPTGVGKTELAKSVAALVFGDESAYLRFDMSEFSSEHAGDRLIGAPPGYVGYEAGGELTNALRQQPFRVVLFDEIEKAHARILDKFLQILEDGRLTDGRGTTTYFSEAVLIFTSNLGTIEEGPAGERVPTVQPGTPFPEVERRLRSAIEKHFTVGLGRPELLNRFGDNIVVFDFIGPDAAGAIFTAQLANILRRVDEEHGVDLAVSPAVETRLREWCTADLSRGGRGIGMALESLFINPLARALFERAPARGDAVTVDALHRDGSTVEVEFR
ncbi:AAA family ATPase [Actinomycetospora soli]|uniref:AAA family ATPase n=1 Tax=Actinomycetospora soli TaxID=2893887 RepID=UPI001E35A8A8|nr:AAA family ATPase [Actinomycetospora soli]MCD2187853.1 AAA family ATPase [Actinomycetospora soli]